MSPEPPFTRFDQLDDALVHNGYAILAPDSFARFTSRSLDDLASWKHFWNDLPPDAHLRDGGRYRRRRHSCFVVEDERVVQVPHRAHWQPVDYNALHGGIERWFEPMDPALVGDPAWSMLLVSLARCATSVLRTAGPWFVEAHPFRIDTTDGIGRPTPEGAHRDGVDLVAVVLIDRHNVKGGETRVFDAVGTSGMRFTMTESWSTLLLVDARVIHESTPIQPADPTYEGRRDTLVVTLRSGGFQEPDQAMRRSS